MIRHLVKSDLIRSVGYEDNMLEIQFYDGYVFRYLDVPENIYDELLTSDRLGTYYYREINTKYKFTRVR